MKGTVSLNATFDNTVRRDQRLNSTIVVSVDKPNTRDATTSCWTNIIRQPRVHVPIIELNFDPIFRKNPYHDINSISLIQL